MNIDLGPSERGIRLHHHHSVEFDREIRKVVDGLTVWGHQHGGIVWLRCARFFALRRSHIPRFGVSRYM